MNDIISKNSKTRENLYDAKYDILKLVLSFFVVAIHTQLFPLILYPWSRMAVPLFFIVASYFLFGKIKNTSDFVDQLIIIKKYVMRNLKLYFFWFTLLLPLTLYIRRDTYFSGDILAGILKFISRLLFGSTFVASWYIMASIIGMLLVFFVSKKLSNKILFILSAFLYVIICLKSSYFFVFEKCTLINTIDRIYKVFLGNPAMSFPVSLFWITCGKCFAEDSFKFKKITYMIMSILFCIFLYVEWSVVRCINDSFNNDCYIMLAPVCIGLFGWIKKCRVIHNRSSIYLKRCSTVIYALHGSMAYVIGYGYRAVFNIDSPLLNFITVSIVCIIIYCFIEIILCRKKQNKVISILQYAY